MRTIKSFVQELFVTIVRELRHFHNLKKFLKLLYDSLPGRKAPFPANSIGRVPLC